MNRFITAGAGLALIATPLVATSATASDTTAERKVAYSVSAKINKATAIAKEDTVKIRGRVTPKAAGDKVVLQQRMEGKKTWSVSGKSKIKANGTYLLKDEPSAAGTRFYRVLKPAAGSVKKGVSRELELVVYGWEKLGYRSRGPATNVFVTNAVIATENYAASIVTDKTGTPASVEYTLGKKCLKLRASYALTDDSASDSTGTAALKVDGRVAFASPLVIGQLIEDHEVNITDAFRISYELNATATTVDKISKVAVATPEVLCTK
ncbi:hypothetical protein [Nocardioides sp. B-3]|uniref:hypothetical protein n=1 Tax=Nocardioides sp. B-3 TaxID=2895565 RepID=UPI0021529550|nr:hypothetical protein [Nocardioides sp. B-3]UUZ60135.1 hypothetical protein LP418_04010 [Nocardioides sp. B-3]